MVPAKFNNHNIVNTYQGLSDLLLVPLLKDLLIQGIRAATARATEAGPDRLRDVGLDIRHETVLVSVIVVGGHVR